MGKVIRNFCWHQNFVPKGLSVPALGLYTCIKSFEMCLKSNLEIVLKLATNGQSDKGFLLTSTFVPKGLSAIYIHKSIKIYTRTRCQVSVYRTTGPLVKITLKFFQSSVSKMNQRTNGPVSLTWVHRICWTSLKIPDYMLYKLSPIQKH